MCAHVGVCVQNHASAHVVASLMPHFVIGVCSNHDNVVYRQCVEEITPPTWCVSHFLNLKFGCLCVCKDVKNYSRLCLTWFYLHCMWPKTLPKQRKFDRESSLLAYEQTRACVCMCAWGNYTPRQTGFTICPCCVLWFPCVIQTNVRLWAGDELWQTAPDILSLHSPLILLTKLSVTFPYSGQWEHLKRHAAFTCSTKN